MKKFGMVALGLAISASWSAVSRAQTRDFPKGTFAISAERMMGFDHWSETVTTAGVEATLKSDQFTLLGMDSNAPVFPGGLNAGRPWNLPRIGLDYFVIDRLSLGGTFYIGYSSSSITVAGVTGSAGTTDVLFSPRVGYAVMFSDVVGIWPRGGLSYYHRSISPDNGPSDTAHFFGFGLEAPLIIALTNGFAITAGPVLDLSIDGGGTTHLNGPANTYVEQSHDLSYVSFGLYGGLMGWI